MIQITSPRGNFLLRLRDDGRFETHSDLCALLITPEWRGRIIVPAGAHIRKLRSKAARARLLRTQLRKDAVVSRREQDKAYVQMLLDEGAYGHLGPTLSILHRRWLFLLGLRHFDRYWHV